MLKPSDVVVTPLRRLSSTPSAASLRALSSSITSGTDVPFCHRNRELFFSLPGKRTHASPWISAHRCMDVEAQWYYRWFIQKCMAKQKRWHIEISKLEGGVVCHHAWWAFLQQSVELCCHPIVHADHLQVSKSLEILLTKWGASYAISCSLYMASLVRRIFCLELYWAFVTCLIFLGISILCPGISPPATFL